jgi:hypothetical protein
MSASAQTLDCVCADAPCPHGHWTADAGCIRADASVLSPRNFIIDATMRPSHGRLSVHRPTIRPLSSA